MSEGGRANRRLHLGIIPPVARERNTWRMQNPGAGASWKRIDGGLPQALVYDVRYDYTDKVLSAGILGRGVWTITNFFTDGNGNSRP